MDIVKEAEKCAKKKSKLGEIVVLCSGCNGYLLRKFAIEREGIQWEEARSNNQKVRVFLCETCDSKLSLGLTVREEK